MTGLIIAAVFILMVCLIGGIILFTILPIFLAGLSIFALIISLLVVSVMVLPYFITLDDLKPDVLALVKETTGREITIGGPIGFTLWPVLGVQLKDISIGNPPDFPDPIMLSAQELSVGVTLSSLISHKLDLRELRMSGAQINLSLNERGVGNWVFSPSPPKKEPATNEGTPLSLKDNEDTETHTPLSLQDINIEYVQITDANLGYDLPDGSGVDLMDIDLSLSLPNDKQRPAVMNGSASYNNHIVTIDMKVDHPMTVLAGEKSPATLTISPGRGNTIAFEGELSPQVVNGKINVDLTSMADILSLAGRPNASAVKVIVGSGNLIMDKDIFLLSSLDLDIDSVHVSGKATIRELKDIDGEFHISHINLDPWIEAQNAATKVASSSLYTTLPQDNLPVFPNRNRNLVTFREPPPDMSFLTDYSAKLSTTLEGVSIRGVDIGKTTLTAKMGRGELDISMSPAKIGDGLMQATGSLTASRYQVDATLTEAQIGPIFKAITDTDRLQGIGSASISLNGTIHAFSNLLQTVSGSGNFALKDGAVKGVNLPSILRQSTAIVARRSNEQTASNTSPTEAATSETAVSILESRNAAVTVQSTDFSTMSGSFKLDKGIVSNDDLKIISPLLRATGQGTANMLTRQLDYRIDARLVATLEGQGSNVGVEGSGLSIPILVTGTFESPDYKPDLRGLVLNNLDLIDRATDAARSGQIDIKNIKEEAKGVLEGLFGR